MAAVVNDEAGSRYTLQAEGGTAIAVYRKRGDVIAFVHTEVPEALEGQGIGSRLIAGAIDDVRRRGYKMAPECSFVRDYVSRHPETQDLVAA